MRCGCGLLIGCFGRVEKTCFLNGRTIGLSFLRELTEVDASTRGERDLLTVSLWFRALGMLRQHGRKILLLILKLCGLFTHSLRK